MPRSRDLEHPASKLFQVTARPECDTPIAEWEEMRGISSASELDGVCTAVHADETISLSQNRHHVKIRPEHGAPLHIDQIPSKAANVHLRMMALS